MFEAIINIGQKKIIKKIFKRIMKYTFSKSKVFVFVFNVYKICQLENSLGEKNN